MGANSKISWTDHTFNPWIGCSKVSEGCKNCYAEEMMDKQYGKVKWGDAGTRHVTSDANWRLPHKWNRDAKAAGVRHKVFCASLADVFEDRPELSSWREELGELIEETPELDWLLLTKRPENILRFMPRAYFDGMSTPNVWLGVSAENQEQANLRVPILMRVPSKIRFVSVEPMLGPVDLTHLTNRIQTTGEWSYDHWNALNGDNWCDCRDFIRPLGTDPIDWVIFGGESGPNFRRCDPQWIIDGVAQCRAAGVPCFVKQGSGRFPGKQYDLPDSVWNVKEFPNAL